MVKFELEWKIPEDYDYQSTRSSISYVFIRHIIVTKILLQKNKKLHMFHAI